MIFSQTVNVRNLAHTILFKNKMIGYFFSAVQKQKDIIFIRHAESKLNEGMKMYSEKYKGPVNYNFLRNYPDYLENVKYSPNYIDAPITIKGSEQCHEARRITDKLNPDIILVSPLERTLQTCQILFGERDIPIFVQPILIQSLRSACDLCGSMEDKAIRYKKYNFQNALKLGEMFNIHYDLENSNGYQQTLKQTGSRDLVEKNKAILSYMRKTYSFQTSKNLRMRIKKVKEMLRNYKKIYHVIVVVSHYNIINYVISKEWNLDHTPRNLLQIKNCQIIFDNFQEIQKHQ